MATQAKAGKPRKSSPAKSAKAFGRPVLYRADFAEQAYKFCLLGATDSKLAQLFGVSDSTIDNWKKKHKDFLCSITRGKEAADSEVAESLFHRAKGYSHPEVHVSNYQGEITLTNLVKHYPPDTPAASLWLRNRQPKLWRDKIDAELSGPNGGPLQVIVKKYSE